MTPSLRLRRRYFPRRSFPLLLTLLASTELLAASPENPFSGGMESMMSSSMESAAADPATTAARPAVAAPSAARPGPGTTPKSVPPPPRPGEGKGVAPGSAKPPARLAAKILPTGIEAKEFVQLVSPTLEKGELIKVVDRDHAALTATTQTQMRVNALARELRGAMKRPVQRLELRAAVLSNQQPETTASAVPMEKLGEALSGIGVGLADFSGVPMPPVVWKLAELAAPATGGGENRVALSDRLTLLYEIRQTSGGDYEVRVSLAERDKGASPFDTGSLGRILLTNEFVTEAGRPVVLGVSNPSRTTVLALVLRPAI